MKLPSDIKAILIGIAIAPALLFAFKWAAIILHFSTHNY